MAELKTSLRIDATTSGQDKVEQLKQALIGIGVSAEQAEDMAKGIAGEIDKLGPKKKAIADLETAFRGLGLSEQEAAVAARETVGALDQVDDKTKRVAKSSWDLASTMKAVAGAAVVKQFLDVNASLESMEKSLELVTGSQKTAAQEMEFVRAEAQRLGLEVISAANSYTQLAASAKGTQLEGKATRDIWTAVAESMARLGKSQADTEGALLAVSQMMSKGTVSAEELRGQLGERLPGAFQAAARAMGTTTKGLDQMLQSGSVIADEFLPKFAAELNKISAGGGEIDTFNAQLNRAKTALGGLAKSIGDTGLFDALSWTLGKAGSAVSSFAGFVGVLSHGLRGNQAEMELAKKKWVEGAAALYGVKQAAGEAGGAIAEMGGQTEVAADKIKREVEGKIRQALLGLKGEAVSTQEALDKLGVDPGKIAEGVGKAEREIVSAFKSIANDPAVNGQVLLGSLLSALDKVSKEAVPEVMFAYKLMAREGRQSADELVAGLNAGRTKLADMWNEMGRGSDAVEQLTESYRLLGIESKDSLDKTAEAARKAYQELVAQKAPAEDLRLAWLEYAQAAMDAAERAGTGQRDVTRATLEAEAAARGYIVTIRDSGQVVGWTIGEWIKEYDRLAAAVDRARRAAQDAAAASAQASIDMYNATSGGIGGMQDSIDEFHQHLQGLGGALAYHINLTRRAVFDATAGSVEAMRLFNELAVGGAMQTHWLGDAVAAFYRAMDNVISRYNDQIKVSNNLISGLRRASQEGAALSESILNGRYNLDLLDSATLANLRAEIDAAHQRIKDFGAEAGDTVADLRRQLAEERGEYVNLEKARGDARLVDLMAQLKDAQNALAKSKDIFGQGPGDPTLVKAVADIQQAIKLQEELNRLREEDAKQREEEAKQRQQQQTTPAPAPAPSPSQTTSAPAPAVPGQVGGGGVNIIIQGDALDADALARKLLPALERIRRLRA